MKENTWNECASKRGVARSVCASQGAACLASARSQEGAAAKRSAKRVPDGTRNGRSCHHVFQHVVSGQIAAAGARESAAQTCAFETLPSASFSKAAAPAPRVALCSLSRPSAHSFRMLSRAWSALSFAQTALLKLEQLESTCLGARPRRWPKRRAIAVYSL